MGHTVGINNEIAQLPQQRERQLTPAQVAINVWEALKEDPKLSELSVYIPNGQPSVAGEQIGRRIKVGPLEQDPGACGIEITGISNDPEKGRSQVTLVVRRKDGLPMTDGDIRKVKDTIRDKLRDLLAPKTFYPTKTLSDKGITRPLAELDEKLTQPSSHLLSQGNHKANPGIELG